MTTSLSQWDPEGVLEIGKVLSGITCVGHAHSKNRRCHNAISAVNRERAANILNQMSSIDFTSVAVKELLEPLGRLLLCLKQHQEQLSNIVGKWRNQIEALQIQEATESEILTSGPVALHRGKARLERFPVRDEVVIFQEIVEFQGLAEKREMGSQDQVAKLIASNTELKRDVESLRAQLTTVINDSTRVRNNAASATLRVPPARAQVSSKAVSTAVSKREVREFPVDELTDDRAHQSLDRYCSTCLQRISSDFELQRKKSTDASQQSCLQMVPTKRSQSTPYSVSRSFQISSDLTNRTLTNRCAMQTG